MALSSERRCPGDPGGISEAVCKARQQRRFEKCAACPHADKTALDAPATSAAGAAYEKIFKAYDVRGIYPDQLNEKMSEQIGAATARFLGAESLVVTRDMRLSGERLARSLIQGILTVGTNVIDCGMVSTDANYFAIGHIGASGGVQVTASHNPAEYNGFKISREQAKALSAETGLENIKRIAMGPPVRPSQIRGKLETRDILAEYAEHVLSFARSPEPLKVAIDAGNGMAGKMLPPVLQRLPLEVTALYFDLDGRFPNHEANPLKPENVRDLQRVVKEKECDLGVAFDGDADRCVFVDERGEIIPSDLITALLAGHLLQRNKGATIVYDLRSSWIVPEEIRKHGGRPVMERVGHSFMKNTMRQRDAVFGGELSGHYYFRENFFADSGAIAFIELLNVLSIRRRPVSELLAPLRRYFSTGEINFEVPDKEAKLRRIKEVFADGRISALDGVTVEYDDWWFNVRPSNTEALLRLNLEATSRELMERALKRVREVIAE